MSDVIVLGGGLAGLSAAAALGGAGHTVKILEARPFLGGRATSYEIGEESIDNCQHVLLRCCVNLLDFYKRLGVENKIAFYSTKTRPRTAVRMTAAIIERSPCSSGARSVQRSADRS